MATFENWQNCRSAFQISYKVSLIERSIYDLWLLLYAYDYHNLFENMFVTYASMYTLLVQLCIFYLSIKRLLFEVHRICYLFWHSNGLVQKCEICSPHVHLMGNLDWPAHEWPWPSFQDHRATKIMSSEYLSQKGRYSCHIHTLCI